MVKKEWSKLSKVVGKCQIFGREKRIIFIKMAYFGHFGQNGQNVSDILMDFYAKCSKNH